VDKFAKSCTLDLGTAQVGYRTAGAGPPLVLLHGYPLSGYTWRKMIPSLSPRYTCYALDVVGFGGSNSSDPENFSSQGEARVFQRALRALRIDSYALLGNDSGGWIARELALLEPERVTRMVLTNTEIPGHRPPWIGFYQRLTRLLGGKTIFRSMLKSDAWRRSSMGFGGCFENLDLIDEEFAQAYLAPLILSHARLSRALQFLAKMDFERVDKLGELHNNLSMPIGLVWGAVDPTFPEEQAREMAKKFPHLLGFTSIPRGKVFMHEEMPEEVLPPVLKYLSA
jgi:haloalkane dehalogenase